MYWNSYSQGTAETMKVKVYNSLTGLFNVKTVGELLAYAEELTVQYGLDAPYECFGHDMDEYVTTYREETPTEKSLRENKAKAHEILKGNSCKDTHNQVISEIGYNNYMSVINELNKGE